MILIALVLALTIAGTLPAQVFADSLPEYISVVKVYEGNCDKAASEGFKILCDEKGNPIDLNQGSGSKEIGAKGNKKVYLGYKTTTDKNDAITDLALMNMKGGYDTAEYDKLMEGQMSQQIVPFVESFLAAINEYRRNYKSSNPENQARAQFVHDALNKLTDDDTAGAGLGDLFLNETVYEMAKPQWNALSDKDKEKTSFYEVNNKVRDSLSDKDKEKTSFYEVNNKVRDSLSEEDKNKHADILTIVAQSNGKITLVMQNLLTRGADTEDDTWLERFEGTTYKDLLNLAGGENTDAMKALDKKYEDDAKNILEKWDAFREQLLDYEKNMETVEKFDEEKAEQINENVENLNEKTDPEEAADTLIDYAEQQLLNAELMNCVQNAAIHDILEETEYLDGTMLDFFSMTKEEVEEDITVLYPIVASLSKGQRAGLEFLSLLDLFNVALTTAEGYKEIDLSKVEKASIYADVDRGIYKKGGVGLTSDALRADALKRMSEQSEDSFFDMFSTSTLVMMALTGVAALGTFLSLAAYTTMKLDVYTLNKVTDGIYTKLFKDTAEKVNGHKFAVLAKNYPDFEKTFLEKTKSMKKGEIGSSDLGKWVEDYSEEYAEKMAPKTNVAGYLSVGFAVAMIALAVVTTYLSYRDMKAHYNVDFTPIPHYMVEEKDITVTNENGEKIVIKNQSAYYKAVESNRKKGDSYYDKIDTCADMNGCVNPQWLALYAAKNEALSPILASSLKVVVGDTTVPQGYDTGIHMLGEKAAFNLNNKLYCWNQSAKSVMVYYKVEKAAASSASSAGSNFSGGTLALTGAGGLALGALISGIAVSAKGRKRKNNSV